MTPTSADVDAAGQRRAFREFVRTHHPDRGGDPVAFQAGLELFGRGARRPARLSGTRPDVTIYHRRGGLGVFVDWLVLRRQRRRRSPRVR